MAASLFKAAILRASAHSHGHHTLDSCPLDGLVSVGHQIYEALRMAININRKGRASFPALLLWLCPEDTNKGGLR